MKSKELYSLRQQLVSSLARALGHPARIAIMESVAEKGEVYFGEIEEQLPLSKATVSRHLTELRENGLIITISDGPKTRIQINRQNWDFARNVFNEVFSGNFTNIE